MLVVNILNFARTLRAAGLAIGPGQVIEAVRAVEVAGIGRRDDFYWALAAVFVHARDQRPLFDQAFHLFWRDPELMRRMLAAILPTTPGSRDAAPAPLRRVREAFAALTPEAERRAGEDDRIETDATLTYSPDERLAEKDFEEMTAAEVAEAKAAIARLALTLAAWPTRRFRTDPRGRRIDMRASLRAASRTGTGVIPLRTRRRRLRPPPLVVLCDISGSMSRYSRMLLHFTHALGSARERVYSFVFGTRLSNVTRLMRGREVDAALARVGAAVEDWDGGTRIGLALRSFNRDWSRRVLGQGALVLLISDGLDRDAGEGLAREVARLQRSCRRLIWLNPLLRYSGFAPRSHGIRAILPHVDEFRPVHNLVSLAELAEALGRVDHGETMARWRSAS